jgi:diguanylate cyclase (GGDEF)-like protein
MISLKKTMDIQLQELLELSLAGYRSTVSALAKTGDQVCPPLGDGLRQSLLILRDRLLQSAAPHAIEETAREIDRNVEVWGQSVAGYYRQKAAEIQEMVLDMAEVAKAVAARDDRYKSQFGEVTVRLQAVGDLEDIVRIRQLIGETATDLRSCVERMLEDGRQSVSNLQQKLAQYEERLADAERRSLTDPLTGLVNRQGIELETEARLKRGGVFCLAVIDLNGFKKINDTHGHPAGDAILRQFAGELKAQFRGQDVVGRWGGDEFVALLDCDRTEAELRIDRVRRWVFGEYALDPSGKGKKVAVSGAVGMAVWSPGQTAAELFAQADRSMFHEKPGRPR